MRRRISRHIIYLCLVLLCICMRGTDYYMTQTLTAGNTSLLSRADLLDKLWPHSDASRIAIHDGRSYGLNDNEQIEKALDAWRRCALEDMEFDISTNGNRSYRKRGATNVGVSPIKDGKIAWFVVELRGADLVSKYGDAMKTFFGGSPVVFGASDTDYHVYCLLPEPVPFADFKRWFTSWGFNSAGRPCIRPESMTRSFVLLPEAGGNGGVEQTYISGTMAPISRLPKELPKGFTERAWDLLVGVVDRDTRMDSLQETTRALGAGGLDMSDAKQLVESGLKNANVFDDDEDDEVDDVIAEAWKQGAEQANMTDFTLAERIRETEKGQGLAWCPDRKTWLVWTGGCWKPSGEEAVHAIIQRYMSSNRFLTQDFQGGGRLGSITRHLRAMKYVYSEGLDSDGMLFNVPNGTVDLRDGLIGQHQAKHYITRIAAAEFSLHVDLNPENSLWMRVLHQILGGEEMVRYMGRVFGYALTGGQQEEELYIAIGDGRNGKSTVFEPMLAAAGEYGVRFPSSLLVRRPGGGNYGDHYAMADFAGKRIALGTEIAPNGELLPDRVKDFADGPGRTVARQIRQAHTSFERTATVFLYGNHDPIVRTTDEGTWRRIVKIPFTHKFEGEGRDKGLKDELIRNHLPDVLAWAVRGCLEWQQHGLCPPEEVLKATAEYRASQDHVGLFLNDCTVSEDGGVGSVAGLYGRYSDWTKAEGSQKLGKREFGAEMRQKGFEQVRTTVGGVNGRYWRGLRVT